jgi:hypothetical protein
MKPFIFFSLMMLFTLNISAQSYDLKYKFQAGKTYLYQENTQNDITQTMMGSEMKIRNTSSNLIRVTSENKTEKGTRLNVSLDSAYVTLSMPMKDTAYSVDQLINKRVSILLSPEGEILEREMIDTVNLQDEMMQMGKREAIQFFKFAPDRKINKGESWIVNHVDSLDMMGGKTLMTSEMEFTIAGNEERNGYSVLRIPFKGKIKIEGGGTIMGYEFFIEGNGSSFGDLYFAPKEGIPVHTEMFQNFDINMAATGDQNMIIPINQEMKTTRTLVK